MNVMALGLHVILVRHVSTLPVTSNASVRADGQEKPAPQVKPGEESFANTRLLLGLLRSYCRTLI